MAKAPINAIASEMRFSSISMNIPKEKDFRTIAILVRFKA